MSGAQSPEDTLQFIEDYRILPALWDVNHVDYNNKIKRRDCLQVLAEKYCIDIDKVKKKIKSLRSYFSKEHSKVIKRNSCLAAESAYTSQWFAYKSLLFIADTITPNQTREAGGTSEGEDEEEESTSKRKSSTGVFKYTPSERLDLNNLNRPIYSDSLHKQKEVINEVIVPTPNSDLLQNIYSCPKRAASTKRNIKETRDYGEEVAYRLTRLAADKLSNKRDESDIFGEMVAAKLKKLNPRNRAIAQNQINNLLFNLELEEIDSLGSLPPVVVCKSQPHCDSDHLSSE